MRPGYPVSLLARADQGELWRRAEDYRRARHRVLEVAHGLPASAVGLLEEIEAAHAVVEAAERAAEAAGPARSRAARRTLDEAYAAEKAVVNRAGFESWTHFVLRRVDALVVPALIDALRRAEAEEIRAGAAWRAVAGDVDVDVAFAAREAIEDAARPTEEGAPRTVPVGDVAAAAGALAPGLSVAAAVRWPGRRPAVG